MGRKSKSAYDTRDRQGQAAFNQVAAVSPSAGLYRELKEVHLLSTELATYFDASGLGLSSAAYSGWAICNGENGTPDLDGKFPRFNAAGAGTEGGSDTMAHTHAVDLPALGTTASGAGSAHNHTISNHKHSLEAGGAAISVTAAGTLRINEDQGPVMTRTHALALGALSENAGTNYTTPLVGDTNSTSGAIAQESAHTHDIDHNHGSAISGAASNTENRPAYYEVVPLMWVG